MDLFDERGKSFFNIFDDFLHDLMISVFECILFGWRHVLNKRDGFIFIGIKYSFRLFERDSYSKTFMHIISFCEQLRSIWMFLQSSIQDTETRLILFPAEVVNDHDIVIHILVLWVFDQKRYQIECILLAVFAHMTDRIRV
jgi:hypothetical protein